MNLLIKSTTIIDPGSSYNGQQKDLRIIDGKISEIGDDLQENGEEVFERKGLHVSPGWTDMNVNFRDPGQEYKEDLLSGIRAAQKGGYTSVGIMPSTLPAIDNKSHVEYLLNRAGDTGVKVYPIGAVSKGREGKDIAEMFDMHRAGAVAFSDDRHPVLDTGLMTNALLYIMNFNGLVISYPDDATVSRDGKMNEGTVSTRLGLKGIPEFAEELMINRDLYLLEYTGSKLHFSTISTPKSVDLIREAKRKGLNVTCEVAAHHLFLNEENLQEYDTNFKVKPPLRTQKTIDALKAGLDDGTIDHITSDHRPEDPETKRVEFDRAAFGVIGLESAFGVMRTSTSSFLSLESLIDRLAIRPRKILGLDIPTIKEGNEAELSFFDPETNWTFQENSLASKSRNTPFLGTELKGKPIATYCDRLFSKSE